MKKKSSITSKLRNAFIAGIVVLVPIGFTLYLTLFLIKISSKLIPNEINPNNYLPFSIPGLEILLSVIFITIVGGISLSFFGKKITDWRSSKTPYSHLLTHQMLHGFKFKTHRCPPRTNIQTTTTGETRLDT
mgnify:CR=1 FL=1